MEKTVKFTPVLTFFGMLIYAGWHFLFPESPYVGLVFGTVIFSASAGLCEVLISPVIAAIPSDDPDREMSKLHSVYAWSVVPVVLIGTLYLLIFGGKHWQWLVIFASIVPIVSIILFSGTKIPAMKTPERVSGAIKLLKNKSLWLCVAAIFLGGAAECNMAQWVSGYAEQALGVPKFLGDVFGVALFGFMLGLGRTLYTKFGKNIFRVLILGFSGATVCYLISCFVNLPIVGLIACAMVGFCASMLWPGSLVVAADKFPKSGVFIYAMMAAGGDMGASLVPQLMGVVTDYTMNHSSIISVANALSYSSEQLGMRIGMLTAAVFPFLGIFICVALWKQGRTTAEKGA